VLARLLLPEQFGLIGILGIFIVVAQSFLDSGFGAALIQKREATPIDTSSVFYFNILVGLVAAVLLCLIAPLIGAFYNQPALTPLARALSLVIVINSFGLIHNTVLNRQINFRTQTKVSLIANVLSGVIGISMAQAGFGVWSLAFQQISGSVFRTASLWLLNPWRPMVVFSLRSLKELFGFGSRLLITGLYGPIFNNIYELIIGKLFSAGDLGIFTRAKTLQELPSNTLSEMVGRVTFPVFSSIQDDRARLKRGLKRALKLLVLVNFPITIGLAVTARPLVLLLLTERWAASVPYLQLLCILGLMFPLHLINLNMLQSLGHSGLFLKLDVIKRAMTVINIAITWRWGISAMIYGMIVQTFVSYYLNSYYTGILIGYPIWEQVRDLSSCLIIALFMGVSVYVVGLLPFFSLTSILAAQIITGMVTYFGLCRIFRLAAFMELVQMIRNEVPFWKVEAGG
jgi:O-antigen/teichoic acid export membrane protein